MAIDLAMAFVSSTSLSPIVAVVSAFSGLIPKTTVIRSESLPSIEFLAFICPILLKISVFGLVTIIWSSTQIYPDDFDKMATGLAMAIVNYASKFPAFADTFAVLASLVLGATTAFRVWQILSIRTRGLNMGMAFRVTVAIFFVSYPALALATSSSISSSSSSTLSFVWFSSPAASNTVTILGATPAMDALSFLDAATVLDGSTAAFAVPLLDPTPVPGASIAVDETTAIAAVPFIDPTTFPAAPTVF